MITTAERARIAEEFRAQQELRKEADQATRVKPLVIEIPFGERAAEPKVRRCCRMRTDGRQCESAALEGYEECLRHFRWYGLHPPMHALPLPEDALSLQEMMARAVDLVMSKRLTAHEAHAIAELCRIMQKNLGGCEHELEAAASRR